MTLDLKRFCHRDPDRLPMSLQKIGAPWSEGDNTYASDGRLILRVARRADVPELAGAPIAAELFELRKPLALTPFGGMDLPAEMIPGDAEASIELRGGVFALAYVRRLSTLPALRLEYRAQPVPPAKPGAPYWDTAAPRFALRFAFGGEDPGEGLLMPRRCRAERHVDLIEEPLPADVSSAVLCWPLLGASLVALAVATSLA